MLRKSLSSTMAIPNSVFIWIDLEMTGLNIDKDEIMEVACVPTTPDLQPLHTGIETQLRVSPESLAQMDDWCTQHHGQSGLTESCRNSSITVKHAEAMLVDYITKHSHQAKTRYMAGNSVYMDRMFLEKWMPAVANLCHYRLIDVSTVKTLAQHWRPDLTAHRKALRHRGLSDVRESIQELAAYRQFLFK